MTNDRKPDRPGQIGLRWWTGHVRPKDDTGAANRTFSIPCWSAASSHSPAASTGRSGRIVADSPAPARSAAKRAGP